MGIGSSVTYDFVLTYNMVDLAGGVPEETGYRNMTFFRAFAQI